MKKIKKNECNRISKLSLVFTSLFIVASLINKQIIFFLPIAITVFTIMNIEIAFAVLIFISGINFMGFYSPELAISNQSLGMFHPNNIVTISIFLFCVISLIKKPNFNLRGNKIIFLFIISYMAVSLIRAPSLFLGSKLLFKFVILFMLVLLFSQGVIHIKKIVKIISVSGIFTLLIFNPIYYILLKNPIFLTDLSGRVRLMGGAALPPGTAFIFGIIGIVSIVSYELFKEKKYIILSCVYTIYSILTYTRKVWIAFVLVFAVYLIQKKKWKTLIMVYGIGLIISLNFVISLFLLGPMDELSTKSDSIDYVSQGRSVLYETFFSKFLEKPVFGLGLEYTTFFSDKLTGIKTLHSEMLRILFDVGIVGFIMFLIFFVKQYKIISSLKEPYKVLNIVLLFFICNSFFGIVFDAVHGAGIIMFSIIGATIYLKEKGVKENEF